jgi:tetratricopeptide (TPR) repeat protein
MMRKICSIVSCVLAGIALVSGCKPKASSQGEMPAAAHSVQPSNYFKTAFQSEAQFVVEAIVSDIAEQMYYAVNHKLPDSKYFGVTATEKSGSPIDAPMYDLQISLDQQHTGLQMPLDVNGPIWSPDVYGAVAESLAKAVGMNATGTAAGADTAMLAELLDGTGETIERENQTLSEALEKKFTDPQLHERAALLLGAFVLSGHAGFFSESRLPLCRLTAHLTMARFFEGANPYGLNGKLAEASMLTEAGDETPALAELKSMETNDVSVAAMVRVLQVRNTGDFRALSQAAHHTQLESEAWFRAMSDYASCPNAWGKLNPMQRQTIEFVRIANEMSPSVEMGHELLAEAIPLELTETEHIYEFCHDDKVDEAGLLKALNEMPERCFTISPGGEVHVQVIGWGQWAFFLQQHLCHAVRSGFHFMNAMWGVPDEAKKFAEDCDGKFGTLRLYPFVRRFDCVDVESYHKSMDDSFRLTIETPQLVSAGCWNRLGYRTSFAPLYRPPNSNPHINEWHNHNPLPGTVYALSPRLDHPSLVGRSDALARFEQLHELAPYNENISSFIVKKKYADHPTYDQVMSLYKNPLPWSVSAHRWLANTVYDQPDQYEKLMLQAAALNPDCYYDLSAYARRRNQDDKAAQYMDKAAELDPDAVRVSNSSEWRVSYYLKKGDVAKARDIADFAGEVYSGNGLAAKALFMELTSNYDGAFEWYAKIEERYNQSYQLASFCVRYQDKTGDKRFDPELQKRIKTVFPRGIENAALNDFKGAPGEGVIVQTVTDLSRAAHLNKGDIIVALNGTRVYDFTQYLYARERLQTPDMDLIVWQNNEYHRIHASPPNHRFGAVFDDYRAK